MTDDQNERERDDEEQEPSPPAVKLPARTAVASPLDTQTPAPTVASPIGTPQPSGRDYSGAMAAPQIAAPSFVPNADPYAEYKARIASNHGISAIHNPFLRTLAHIGDIAGTAIVPGVTSMIPGTSLNEAGQTKRALSHGKELENENEQALKDTQAQAATKETGARTAKEEAQTEAIKNPPAKEKEEQWSVIPNVLGPNGEPVQQEKNSGQVRVVTTPGVTGKEQAQKGVRFEPEKGIIADPNGKAYSMFDPALPPELKTLVDAYGKQHSQKIQEESDRQARSFAQQMNMFNARQEAPTTTERNAAARASIIVKHIPNVIKEINDLGDELGPITGRWNDFMQGKVGMENPRFAGLQADLTMVSTGVALAHAVGRLPENLRQEFQNMIDAPQQNPKNIVSVLNHIKPFLQDTADLGGPREKKNAAPEPEGNAPPPGAKIRNFNPNTGRIE